MLVHCVANLDTTRFGFWILNLNFLLEQQIKLVLTSKLARPKTEKLSIYLLPTKNATKGQHGTIVDFSSEFELIRKLRQKVQVFLT